MKVNIPKNYAKFKIPECLHGFAQNTPVYSCVVVTRFFVIALYWSWTKLSVKYTDIIRQY